MATAELDIIVKLRDEFSRGLSGITGSMSQLGGVVASGAAAGIAGVTAALGAATMAGLSYNNAVEQAGAKIQAFTKDHEETARILQMVQERASQTPFAYTEMANAASALMPTARAANAPLEDLLEISEILAASNPAQGLEGASVALREAVSGDYVSLIERFNMPRSFINQLKEEGVPALEIVRQSLQSLGFDTDLVAGLANTAEGRWSTFQDTLQALAGQITQPIFNAFSGGLGQINDKLTEMAPMLEEFAGQVAYVIEGVIKGFSDAQGPLNALVEYSGELPGVWVQVSDAAAGLYKAIEAIKPVIAPLIPIIQDNLIPILISLAAIIGIALVAAFVTIVGPILLVAAKIALISAAIGGLVFAGVKLYQHVTTTYPQLSEQIVRAFETAKVFVMTAMQVIATVVQTITAAVFGWWQENGDRIIAQVQTTFNTAVAVISSVMMQIEATVATITEVIAKFWATYGDEIIATVNDLATQLGALWDEIVKLVNAAMIGIGQLINGALSEIQKYWETYGNDIQIIAFNVFNGISQQISGFMEIIRGIVKTVTALIQGDWQGAADGLRIIVDGISTYLVGTWNTIVAVIDPILDTITAAITSAFTDAWNGITGTLTTIQNGITSAFTDAWNGITGTLTTIQNGITNAFTGAWNGITGTLTTIQNGIVNTFTNAWNGITATLTRIQIGIIAAILRAWTGIVNWLAAIRNGIINAIKAAWDGLVANLSKIRQGIIDAIMKAWTGIVTFLTNIRDGIINAVSRAWTGIVTFLTNIRDGIINAIKAAWDGLVANLTNIRQGIIDAITKAWTGIVTFLTNIRDGIINAIKAAWDGLGANLTKIKDGIINAVSGAWNGISDTLTTIRLRIIQAIQQAWDGISGVLTEIRNGIRNAITGALDAISAPLSNIKTAVIDALTAVRTWLESFSLGQAGLGIADSLVGGMIRVIAGAVDKLKDAFKDLVKAALDALPKPIRDALALLGFKVTKSAAATLPAPPPTTRGAAVGSVLPGASVTAGSSPSIVINIGSVRDARDIDAIRRAVRDSMDEAARRGIVQSQLPRGI